MMHAKRGKYENINSYNSITQILSCCTSIELIRAVSLHTFYSDK